MLLGAQSLPNAPTFLKGGLNIRGHVSRAGQYPIFKGNTAKLTNKPGLFFSLTLVSSSSRVRHHMPPWPTSRSPPTKSKVMAWRAGGPMPFRRVESEVVSSLGIHTPRANHRPSNPPNHIPADLHTKSRPVRAPGRTAYIAALAQLSHSLSQVDRSPETSLSVPFPPADRSPAGQRSELS